MITVTFANYDKVLYNGARIIYGNRVDRVQKDPEWNGGYRIGGSSICAILEDYDLVELIKE